MHNNDKGKHGGSSGNHLAIPQVHQDVHHTTTLNNHEADIDLHSPSKDEIADDFLLSKSQIKGHKANRYSTIDKTSSNKN